MQPPAITFEEFVAARGPALVRLGAALSGDAALAEDLVQQTLARAWLRWRRIGGLGDPGAYVRRMLVREHLSWRRRRSSTERPSGDLPEAATHGDHAERSADHHALAGQLLMLPVRQRAVLVLRYYEDLPDPEIAQLLGCADATVRSLAARGLAALRVRADQDDPVPPGRVTRR